MTSIEGEHESTDPFGLVGRSIDDRYMVQAFVASGGFGAVYAASHAMLQNRVAIKVLSIATEVTDDERRAVIEAFNNEARALAHLAHPAIVRAIDFGVSAMPTGGYAPWMALEWIDGYTLRDDLRARRSGPARTRQQCLAEIRSTLEALGYAHRAGLAHRDVKPANLMFDRRAGFMKVLDFGVAKIMAPDENVASGYTRTRSAVRAYSAQYAAPEQFAGTRTGPWTDVYAMALVITEMLTNRPAYQPGSKESIVPQAFAPVRPTPATQSVDVGSWEPVLQRALATHPKDRYADALDLLAALETALATNRIVMPTANDRTIIDDPNQAAWANAMAQALAENENSGSSSAVSGPLMVQPAVVPGPPPGASPRAATRSGRGATIAIVSVLAVLLAGGAGVFTWYRFGRAAASSTVARTSAGSPVEARTIRSTSPAPSAPTSPAPMAAAPANAGASIPTPTPPVLPQPAPMQPTAAAAPLATAPTTAVVAQPAPAPTTAVVAPLAASGDRPAVIAAAPPPTPTNGAPAPLQPIAVASRPTGPTPAAAPEPASPNDADNIGRLHHSHTPSHRHAAPSANGTRPLDVE